VKGTRGGEVSFILTAAELRRMQTDPAARLCVVTEALQASASLWSWDLAGVERIFAFSPVSY
jgi:hypothetical protein